MRIITRHLIGVGATLLLAAAPTAGAAQRQIEEIIVTATKRAENVQDIPIAISAFTGEDLQSRGVQDLYGLQEVSPSISVYSSNSTSNGGTVRVRGVGTTGNNPGLEAAVGTFIDGVYRSRAGLAFTDLVDIERVELLRGPQGTLFGKNTSAGALHIITKAPEYEWHTMAAVSVGNLDTRRVQGSVTGPLIDDVLAFRLAGNYHERDGYYEDDVSNDAYDSRDRWSLKGQLLWEPSDTFSTRLIVDYQDRDEDCCPANFRFINRTEVAPSGTTRGPLSSGQPPGVILDDLLARNGRPAEAAFFPEEDDEVGVNFDPVEQVEDWGIQNEANWQVNDTMTLTSITAWRSFEVSRLQDIDFTGARILEPQFTSEKIDNFSQEFRLLGTWNDVDWLIGAYIYTEEIDTDESIRLDTDGPEFLARLILSNTNLSTALGPPAGAGVGRFNVVTRQLEPEPGGRANFQPGDGYFARYGQDTDGWSIFSHNTWHVTSRLDFTLGARFSREKKEAEASFNGVSAITGTVLEAVQATLNETFNEAHCSGVVAVGSLCDNVPWKDSNVEKEWTATLRLSYALDENVNVYGGYSRGYKAGGFNLDQQAIELDYFASFLGAGGAPVFLGTRRNADTAAANATFVANATRLGCTVGATNPPSNNAPCSFFDDDHAFDPEFVNAWELGLKGQFLERTLTTNVALFYSRFQNFQLNTFTGTGFIINNTNRMTSKGVELESTWNPLDGVYFTFGATYADSRYGGSLNDADQNEVSLYIAGDFTTLEDFQKLEDIENSQITHSPYWQGSSSLFVEQQIPGFDLLGYANINVSYRGEHNTGSDLDPEKVQEGLTLVNTQFGVRTLDERYDVQFWVRNLTDKQANTVVFDSVFQAGSFSRFFSPPRQFGATVQLKI